MEKFAKTFLRSLLSVVLVVGLMPLPAFADERSEAADLPAVVEAEQVSEEAGASEEESIAAPEAEPAATKEDTQAETGSHTTSYAKTEPATAADEPANPGSLKTLNMQIVSVENPLSGGTGEVQTETIPAENAPAPLSNEEIAYLTQDEAVAQITENMANRNGSFSVSVQTDENYESLANDMFYAAMEEDGNPTHGDYLRWIWDDVSCGVGGTANEATGVYYMTYTYEVTYKTTLVQEEELLAKMDEVLTGLALDGKTDYEKTVAIYDYICENVAYDHANLDNDSYRLQFTAYAAMVNGTSVCQGYASLFYLMAGKAGLSTRMVAGTSKGEAHSWNIVKLDDGYYYNIDSTWDSELIQAGGECKYFLKSEADFVDHTRGGKTEGYAIDYGSDEFHASYPMAENSWTSGAPEADPNLTEGWNRFGTCEWRIDGSGCLTIRPLGDGESGEFGKLYGYASTPWFEARSSITSVVFEAGVKGCETLSYLFEGCSNLKTIDFSNFDTSAGLDMQSMFQGCKSLDLLDLSKFNTSNVTNMALMFEGCSSLRSINLSSFNTSNVTGDGEKLNCTGMFGMFWGCESLSELDLASFDTSKVENMAGMFKDCSSLTTLDLSSFNTSAVTGTSEPDPYGQIVNSGMASMFAGCSNLQELNLSGFDTSSVKNMTEMFGFCSSLKSLNVSSFDTSSLVLPYRMFYECESLESLDISGFDTSNSTIMTEMFAGCDSLSSLDLSSFDTSSVESMLGMFARCAALTSIDLSSFDTSSVTTMGHMFNGCSSLTKLDLNSFETPKLSDMENMFYDCSALEELRISRFDTSKISDMSHLFFGCHSLEKLSVSSFDTSNVSSMSWMFGECFSLPDLDVSGFDTKQVTNMTYMFYNCKSLKELDVSSFDTPNVESMAYMFGWCRKLEKLDISSFDMANNKSMQGMFETCVSLKKVILSGIDTSGVSNMSALFQSCSSLSDIDLSGLNTESVVTFDSMFNGCWAMTDLDLTTFDTSKVKNFDFMFSGCENLESLDLTGWNISSAESMAYMFYGCHALPRLIVDLFDTGAVKKMAYMFYDCPSLTEIPLGISLASVEDTAKENCFWLGSRDENVTTRYLGDDETILGYDWEASSRELVGAEEPEVVVPVPKVDETLTYNGLEQAAVKSSEGYVLSGDVSAMAAGEYTATATLEKGYVWSTGSTEAIEISWSIAPIELDSSMLSLWNSYYPYDGAAKTPDVHVEVNGITQMDAGYALTFWDSKATEQVDPVDAGAYKIRIESLEGANTVGSAWIGFEISPDAFANFQIVLSEDSFVYDGKEHRPEVLSVTTEEGTSLREGVDFELSFFGGEAYPGSSQWVQVKGIGNYEGSSANAFFQIEKAPLDSSMVTLEDSSITYKGVVCQPSVSVSVGDRVDSWSYDITYWDETGENQITPMSVGSYKAKVESLDSAYTVGSVWIDFEIVPAVLTASYVSESIEWGKEPSLRVEVTGFANGETTETAAGYTAPTVSAPESVEPGGSYELTPSGGSADNYVFEYASGTLTSIKPDIAIPAPEVVVGLIYDGTVQEGVVSREGFVLSGVTATSDAGEYVAVATLEDGYIWSDGSSDPKNIVWSIAPAPLSVRTESASKTYDGDPLTASGTLSGLQAGETASLITTGIRIDTGYSDNGYFLRWDGTAKESNYYVASEELGILTVTENTDEIIVTTTGGTFVYDGQPHGGNVSVSNLPKGYTLSATSSYGSIVDVSNGQLEVGCSNLVILNAQGENVTSRLNVKYVNGFVEVIPATLTASYVSESVEWGKTPELKVEVTGFVAGETADTVSGYVAPTVSAPADPKPGASYELTPSGGWGGWACNYIFDYVPGTLSYGNLEGLGTVVSAPEAISGLVYDGSEQTGVKAGEGYILSGDVSAINAGSYTAIATLDDGCIWADGSSEPKKIVWDIEKIALDAAGVEMQLTNNPVVTYTGHTYSPSLLVFVNDVFQYMGGVPYEMTYWNESKTEEVELLLPGKYFVKAKSCGHANTKGEVWLEFKILPSLKEADVVMSGTSFTYTGKPHEPVQSVSLNGVELVEGVDYVVEYFDSPGEGGSNIHAGTASVVIRGIGDYGGATTKTFTIEKATLTATYLGGECSPDSEGVFYNVELTGFVNGETAHTAYDGIDVPFVLAPRPLKPGSTYELCPQGGWARDYKFEYVPGLLTVKRASLADLGPIFSFYSSIYNGKVQKPTLRISYYDGTPLVEGRDYTAEWLTDCKSAGYHNLKLTGIGGYKGTTTLEFVITASKLSNATVTLSSPSYVYNGSIRKPAATVKVNGVKQLASEYMVTYWNNAKTKQVTPKLVGTYWVKVTAKSDANTTGAVWKKLTVNPKATANLKLTRLNNGFKASWTKRTVQCSGYQVAYRQVGTSAWKTKTVVGYKTNIKSVTGLKDKKSYQVKVRTHKTVNGVKYYSAYTPVKTVKTR